MSRLNIPLSCLLLLLLVAGCSVSKKQRAEADTHFMLGVSYLREGNATSALKEFLLAEENNPNSAEIQNALGQAYRLKRAFPQAEQHYLRALKLDPDNPLYQNNLADLYLNMERYGEAIRLFRKAADNLVFSSPEVALTGICYAHLQKGEYLDAVTACREALGHSPRFAQAHLRLGEAYYGLDRTGPAIEEFKQALEIVPDYVLAHYRLGQAYMKNKEPDKARASFREVLRLAPPDSELGRSVAEYLKILQ